MTTILATGQELNRMMDTHKIVSPETIEILGVNASAVKVVWTDDLEILNGEQTTYLLPTTIYQESRKHQDEYLNSLQTDSPRGFE